MPRAYGNVLRVIGLATISKPKAATGNRQQDEEGRLGAFIVELLQHVAIERDASCAEEAGPKNKPSRGVRD